MSGFNTRTRYDNDFYNEFVNQQTNEGNYRLDPTYSENNLRCHSLYGPRQNNNKANTEVSSYNLLDRREVESYLRNLDMPNSRSMNFRTLNDKNNKLSEMLKNKQLNVNIQCDNYLDNNNTRLDNNILDLKSVNINRYEYPIVDPQSYVFNGIPNTEQVNNDRNGVNSRLRAKDDFKFNK